MVHERQFPADADLRKARPDLVIHCPAPCLGYSPLRNSLIWTFLKPRIPITVSLAWARSSYGWSAASCLGITAALRRGKFADRTIVGGALVFYSFPTFFLSLLLLQVVVFQLNLMQTPVYTPISQGLGSYLYNLVLPCLTLALVFAAAYVRITRTYMLETMGEDYLRTARAKGLKCNKIIFKHTLRAALTPIITLAGSGSRCAAGGRADHRDGLRLPGRGLHRGAGCAQLRPADDGGHRVALGSIRNLR